MHGRAGMRRSRPARPARFRAQRSPHVHLARNEAATGRGPANGRTIERLFCVQPVDSRPGSRGQPPRERWTTPARTWTSHSPTWTNRGQPSEPTKTTCCGRSTRPTTTSCVFSLTATRRRRIVLRSLRTMRAASPGTPAGPKLSVRHPRDTHQSIGQSRRRRSYRRRRRAEATRQTGSPRQAN
jgi:hypothetical protein